MSVEQEDAKTGPASAHIPVDTQPVPTDAQKGEQPSEGLAEQSLAINKASAFQKAHALQQVEAYKVFRAKLLTPEMFKEQAVSEAPLDDAPLLLTHELLRIAKEAVPLPLEKISVLKAPLPEDLIRALEERRENVKRMMMLSKIPMAISTQELLNEQERLREERANARIAELEAMEQARGGQLDLKLRIELKTLRLRHLQREARETVLRFMKRARQPDFAVDHTYRKRKKQSLREIRALEKLEMRQRQERGRQVQQAYYDYLQSIVAQAREVQARARAGQQRNARLAKAVMQHHAAVEKEEQKRLERLSKERLRALKADDEEAYLKLIDQQKDTRLTHLLRQTDEFLDGLTAKVLAQQDDEGAENLPVEDGIEEAVAAPGDYYSTAHRVKEEVLKQPSLLVGGKLKEYQVRGLQWMLSLYNNHLNGILADEMGLGKTIQTISLLAYLMEHKGQNGPFLVVVPLSTLTNWSMEFEKWAPSIAVVEYRGALSQRKTSQHIIRSAKFNVVLTTYEYVIKDKAFLSKPRWLHMIIDEGHRMKNSHSKLAITLSQHYHARYRLILTGTPLQNSLPELWALLNFILPKIFNSSRTFDEWFNAPFANTGERIELNEEETLLIIRRLHKVLRPFLLRRLKRDVEAELPEKIERIIKCPMSALQQRLYAMITQKNLSTSAGGIIRRFNNVIMQLRKICNHPFLFEEVEQQLNPHRTNNDLLYRVAGKFELLQRILPKLHATGHRLLVFFQMTQVITIMEDFLGMLGFKYLRLDGSTKAEERTDLLAKFNAPNSPYFAFLLSTRAGGLGLNLQTADTVIIFDSDWNPHQDLQAQDRAHRIGQTKEVRIFRLITSNSIEEYILERAQFKLNLDGKVIQAGKFDHKSTNEEREALLRALLEGEAHEEGCEGDDEDYKDDDELNELIARGDAELGMFKAMDEQARDKRKRLIEVHELPKVFLVEEAATPASDASTETPSIRSSRLRNVAYDETLSDDAWLRRLEKETSSAGTSATAKKRAGKTSLLSALPAPSPLRLKLTVPTTFMPDSSHLLEHYERVLETIESATDPSSGRYRADLFLELPSMESYPDYYQQIRQPVSLAEVRSRLASGEYASLQAMRADIELMTANAMRYNVEGSLVYEDAMELRRLAFDEIDAILEELAGPQEELYPSDDQQDEQRSELVEEDLTTSTVSDEDGMNDY